MAVYTCTRVYGGTRDLCRDSPPILSLPTTYNTARAAQIRGKSYKTGRAVGSIVDRNAVRSTSADLCFTYAEGEQLLPRTRANFVASARSIRPHNVASGSWPLSPRNSRFWASPFTVRREEEDLL